MRVIAHRSGPTEYPEQTIQSAADALAKGAELIELDVRFTKDGDLAIHHDDKADYLFGADKSIPDMTTEEFLALRHKKNPAYGSHLLDHYMQSGIFPLLIHLKDEATIPKILSLAVEYGCLDRIILGVHSVSAIGLARSIYRDIRILAFMPSPDNLEDYADAGANYIRLWEGWMTDENIARVRSFAGVELWCMTGCHDGYEVGYTSKENLRGIIAKGADGILVNDVTFLLEELK